MLVVAGRIRVSPEKVADALPIVAKVMEATQQEAGCITYNFAQDIREPSVFWLFEEWESAEALTAHFSMPHMAEFLTQAPRLGVLESKIQKYEVSSVGPVG